jgi:amino acid transporter
VIKLRYSHPDVPRPYRIPFGKIGLWTAGILTTAWCALTTIAIIYPGIGTAHPDDSLPEGFEHQRLEYTLSQVIPLVVMILIGLLFYALGAPTRRQARADAASSQVVPDEATSSEAPASEATSSETPASEATSSDTTSG